MELALRIHPGFWGILPKYLRFNMNGRRAVTWLCLTLEWI